jgi:alpha/beta hydrolase fold
MILELVAKAVDSLVRRGRTSTPPIASPNGIAALEWIELNGHPQWLLLRGEDVSSPVLLFVHGGPGVAEMWLAHHTMRELEKHFVCVNWDQPGAGKSFSPTPRPETMTIERFVDDTIALIDLLLERFGKKKLFLVGHSLSSRSSVPPCELRRRRSSGSRIRPTCRTSRSPRSFSGRSSSSGAGSAPSSSQKRSRKER